MRHARTCYDHLAGRLGVTLTDALLNQGYLTEGEQDFALTESGQIALEKLGLDVGAAQKKKRAFARRCLDWSERRPHLGGALGAALLVYFEEEGIINRVPESRIVTVSEQKIGSLSDFFGTEFTQLFQVP